MNRQLKSEFPEFPEFSPGQIVFIGTKKRGPGQHVVVKWTPDGHELDLRERVQATTHERMLVLGMAVMLPADVERFRAKHKKSRRGSHWFECTDEFMKGASEIEDQFQCMEWCRRRTRVASKRRKANGRRGPKRKAA